MTPHQQMSALDEDGTAYVVTNIRSTAEDFTLGAEWDVISHSEEWLQLRFEGGQPFFLNLRHISALNIKQL